MSLQANEHYAIMADKRWDKAQGLYLVTVQCSGCHAYRDVAYRGWDAIKCSGCTGYIVRNTYRSDWKRESMSAWYDRECNCDNCKSCVKDHCGIDHDRTLSADDHHIPTARY